MFCIFYIILLTRIPCMLGNLHQRPLTAVSTEEGFRRLEFPGVPVLNVTENEYDTSVYSSEPHGHDVKGMICSTFPSVCSRLESFTRRFFQFGAFEGRGPKDLIAIVSTLMATILGAILVKLNVIIVLSLISVAIGKLLLLSLALKTHLSHKAEHHPVVYEKVYYPHHSHVAAESFPEGYPGYGTTLH